MSSSNGNAFKKIASNRRAFHDYMVLERLEAGIELRGTEVKSIRQGHVSFTGSFAAVEGGEVWIQNLHITPYDFGNRFNHDPLRPRRLLLHRREILKVKAHIDQKGHALIPLSVYLKRGRVKIELGICKGKGHQDKRETLKRRTADMEARRAMAAHRR